VLPIFRVFVVDSIACRSPETYQLLEVNFRNKLYAAAEPEASSFRAEMVSQLNASD
jgi:hypothetical protein